MTEQELYLQLFDVLAARAADPARLCADYGLPPDATPAASSAVAVGLAGVRVALAGWLPRPPLQDDESGSFGEAIGDLVLAAVGEALAPLLAQRDSATMKARSRLMEWNRERPVVKTADLPSRAALAALREPRLDDTMERVDLGDGRFRFQYRVRPEG